jgi:hypothetical protein
VISAEDAVVACPSPLLETGISEALLWSHLPAIEALGPIAAESSCRASECAIPPEPAGHFAIGIWHAAPVSWIMHPYGIAQPAVSMEISKPITVKEGVVHIDVPAVPVGSPSPTAPSAEIKTKIYAGIPSQADVDARV